MKSRRGKGVVEGLKRKIFLSIHEINSTRNEARSIVDSFQTYAPFKIAQNKMRKYLIYIKQYKKMTPNFTPSLLSIQINTYLI